MIDEKKLINFINSKEFQTRIIRSPKSIQEVLREFIEEQPKIGEWIPCKDRLPNIEVSENVKAGFCTDNGRAFLITDSEGYVYESTFWVKAQRFDDDAVAWMPKPEPYLGGKTEV